MPVSPTHRITFGFFIRAWEKRALSDAEAAPGAKKAAHVPSGATMASVPPIDERVLPDSKPVSPEDGLALPAAVPAGTEAVAAPAANKVVPVSSDTVAVTIPSVDKQVVSDAAPAGAVAGAAMATFQWAVPAPTETDAKLPNPPTRVYYCFVSEPFTRY